LNVRELQMTISRQRQVDLNSTPYYHCIVRCVRQSFLCGKDTNTGRNFEHRRGWIVERLKMLSQIFAINICAYSVMSNHYHVILHVNTAVATMWSLDEVIDRWCLLFHGGDLVAKRQSQIPLNQDEEEALILLVEKWRSQLIDISWFMRCMNEKIARDANAEDECKGRFWEGRFKSQALLDINALLSCMVYVDLNPIRAGITNNLEHSDFTSIQERLAAYAQATLDNVNPNESAHQPKDLVPFSDVLSTDDATTLPMTLPSYLSLVDATGRAIRSDKVGYIPDEITSILDQLNMNPFGFINVIKNYTQLFSLASGSPIKLKKFIQQFGGKRIKTLKGCHLLYKKIA